MNSISWLSVVFYIALPVRLILAGVYIYSAFGKFRYLGYFAKIVGSYELLPAFLVTPFAYSLPWLETASGGLLLAGWYTRPAAGISSLLMLMFTAAISINLLRSRRDLDCGCSGAGRHHKIDEKLILRDLAYFFLSIFLLFSGGGALALENQPVWVQRFIFDSILLEIAIPLGLSGAGLILLFKLFHQLGRLLTIYPLEDKS